MTASSSGGAGWDDLLVGPWMPGGNSGAAAATASQNRQAVAAAFEDYSGVLGSVVGGALAGLEGRTAEKTHDLFNQGRIQAVDIEDRNRSKSRQYSNAAEAINGLTSDLKGVSEAGSSAINKIQKDPAIIEKVAPIMSIISIANTESARLSQKWSAPILQGISDLLAESGDSRSAEQFMKENGLDHSGASRPPATESLLQEVTNRIAQTSSKPSGSSAGAEPPSHFQNGANLDTDYLPAASADNASTSGGLEGASTSNTPIKYSGETPVNNARAVERSFADQVTAVEASGSYAEAPPIAGTNPSTAGLLGNGGNANLGAANASTVASHGGGGGSPVGPSSNSLSPSTPNAPLSPESLAESFNSGMQSGAPMSAGAEALSQGISETAQQAPQNPTPPAPVAPTAPSGGFAYEAPQHFSEPAAPAPAPTETTQQPMYAAPVAAAPAAPVAPMAPPPAATAGPLPAYGSDLRPTATAAAPPPAAAPAPLSAPTSAASGTAASNQPAVVRQAPTAATPTGVTPAGIAETAMGSAATGAIAGAAAQQSIEQARLDRLLEAVARQEPKLKWAIGDREDGTTVLVTDLASGWIPPHIEIPKGVELLQPQKRRGGLEHLLGETVNHSIWTPGHYLPNPKDVEPVEMTFRARQVPDIEELNWELTQATNWRDGLPRLAHTLTKAGIAGTGVLESEADLLYEHLTAARDKVVRAYPDSVDPTDVGNWQLLAAISGLIAKDKTTLKYHFAWFQAVSMATQGGSR